MNKLPKIYTNLVTSFIKDIERAKQGREFEKEVGVFVLRVIADLDNKMITAAEADDIFSYIDEIGVPIHKATTDASTQVIRDLLFEGQILHDFGTPYGADLEMMKSLAHSLIKE